MEMGDHEVEEETNFSPSFTLEELEAMDREIERQSMQDEEESSRPTWACREAVEALEKVVVMSGSDRDDICAVCLEEFSCGTEATKMPCSHLFHAHCIVGWLGRQRFCPLCRYELPPANHEPTEEYWPSDDEIVVEAYDYHYYI